MGTAEDTVPYAYNNDEWGDLLTSYDDTAITYDGIGNPLTYGTTEFTWEHGRQLRTLTEGGVTWTYTYNNAGLRTGRYVENGASYSYVYNGSALVQMTVNGQTVSFTYDAGGIPLTIKVGENTYYYITNIQGDVMALVDSTGATIVSYSYSAYGEVTVTDGANTTVAALNPFTYRGYVYDSETGLFYLQSRYYDPEIGRFLNADSYVATGQGFVGNNMFAYCLNNPVNFVDRSGNNAEAVQWWTGTMWWLCAADSVAPIGDVIYGIGIVILLYEAASYSPQYEVELYNESRASKNQQEATSSNATVGTASPPPPNNNKDNKYSAGSTYNKGGIRVDFEYNGNGTGNVHIHVKGLKFHYDIQGFFKLGAGNTSHAPQYIQRLLNDPQIMAAILKAVRFITELGGELE